MTVPPVEIIAMCRNPPVPRNVAGALVVVSAGDAAQRRRSALTWAADPHGGGEGQRVSLLLAMLVLWP